MKNIVSQISQTQKDYYYEILLTYIRVTTIGKFRETERISGAGGTAYGELEFTWYRVSV